MEALITRISCFLGIPLLQISIPLLQISQFSLLEILLYQDWLLTRYPRSSSPERSREIPVSWNILFVEILLFWDWLLSIFSLAKSCLQICLMSDRICVVAFHGRKRNFEPHCPFHCQCFTTKALSRNPY